MANTRDYMDYLDQSIGIAPAYSQEEYQASEVIHQIMSEHGLEANIEEFDSAGVGTMARDVLAIILFITMLVGGLLQGAPHIILLLAALAAAGLLTFMRFVRNIFEDLGPARRSQNVVAVRRALDEEAARTSRPIVIVAHYDAPRESVLRKGAMARYQALLVRAGVFCPAIVVVTLFFQIMMFLPEAFRMFMWVVGLIACIPAVGLGIVSMMSHFGNCTVGANDNKSSVSALLSMVNKVSPADDRANGASGTRPTQRRGRKEESKPVQQPRRTEVVEEMYGVRHGEDMLRALNILPPSCEITYEEPRIMVVDEAAEASLEQAYEPEDKPENKWGNEYDESDASSVADDNLDEETYGDGFEDDLEDYDEEFDEDEEPEGSRASLLSKLPTFMGGGEKKDEENKDSVDDDYDEEYDYDDEDEFVADGDEDEEPYDDDADDYDDEFDEDYEDDDYDEEFDEEAEQDDDDAPIGSSIGAWFSERVNSIKARFASNDKDYEDDWIEDEDEDSLEEEVEDDEYEDWDEEVEETSDDDAEEEYDEEEQDDLDEDDEDEDQDELIDDYDEDEYFEDDDEEEDLEYLDDPDVDYDDFEYEDDEFEADDFEDYEDDVEAHEEEPVAEPIEHEELPEEEEDDPDAEADLAYDAEMAQEYAEDFEYDDEVWYEDEPAGDQELEDEQSDEDEDYVDDEYLDEYDSEESEYEGEDDVIEEQDEYLEEEEPKQKGPSLGERIMGFFKGNKSKKEDNVDYEEDDEFYLEDDENYEDEAYEEEYVEYEEEYVEDEYAEGEYAEEEYVYEDGGYEEYEAYDEYEEPSTQEEPSAEPVAVRPPDPNELHFDREEDDDIVARDDSGLNVVTDTYDLYQGDVERESRRARPAAIDDPTWGTSTYQPTRPALNIARRAALYDLPDPSGAEIDPLADDYDYEEEVAATQEEATSSDAGGGFWNDASGDQRASEWKGGAALRDDLRDDMMEYGPDDLQDAMLELGDDFLNEHDIWFVATGASYEGHGGMKAFLDAHKRDIRGAFLINLECVGAGSLAMYVREGLVNRRRADRRLVRLISDIAKDLHIGMDTAMCDWTETDAATAMRARVRAVTIVGLDEDDMPAYSQTVDDVPENVNPDQVDDVVRVVTEVIRRA